MTSSLPKVTDEQREIAWMIVVKDLCADSVCTFKQGCGCSDAIASAIAQAVAAERERAIVLIDNAKLPNHTFGYSPGWNTDLQMIIDAIRQEPTS